jgi:type IV secretory pathway TrbF-like protein
LPDETACEAAAQCQGAEKGDPPGVERRYVDNALAATERWSAILTIVVQTPTDADRLKKYPLGVYVHALNWSKELG